MPNQHQVTIFPAEKPLLYQLAGLPRTASTSAAVRACLARLAGLVPCDADESSFAPVASGGSKPGRKLNISPERREQLRERAAAARAAKLSKKQPD